MTQRHDCEWRLNEDDDKRLWGDQFRVQFTPKGKPHGYWKVDAPIVINTNDPQKQPLEIQIKVPSTRFPCPTIPWRVVTADGDYNNFKRFYPLIKKMYTQVFTKKEAHKFQRAMGAWEDPPQEGDHYCYPRLCNLYDEGLSLVKDECTSTRVVLEMDYGS